MTTGREGHLAEWIGPCLQDHRRASRHNAGHLAPPSRRRSFAKTMASSTSRSGGPPGSSTGPSMTRRGCSITFPATSRSYTTANLETCSPLLGRATSGGPLPNRRASSILELQEKVRREHRDFPQRKPRGPRHCARAGGTGPAVVCLRGEPAAGVGLAGSAELGGDPARARDRRPHLVPGRAGLLPTSPARSRFSSRPPSCAKSSSRAWQSLWPPGTSTASK